MSRPTEVLVKVVDLETAAVPEPEWEPTEKQTIALCRALDKVQPGWYSGKGGGARQILQALHQEGVEIQ